MRLRNISGLDLWIEVGGRPQRVKAASIVDVADDAGVYWQTGATGETPLWEIVPGGKKSPPVEIRATSEGEAL